jgi:hypothetical protein
MPFLGLTKEEEQKLEVEVVPRDARRKLTRLIRHGCSAGSSEEPRIELIRLNDIINIALQVLDRPRYVLRGDDWGEFDPAEYAWHRAMREVIMHLPTTRSLLH